MQAHRIKNLFSVIARHYDFLNALLSLKRDKSWRQETVKASEIELTSKVLDVCTGTGELALAYSDKIGAEGFVIGSDFCFEMLVIGDQKVKAGRGKEDIGRLEERKDGGTNLSTFQPSIPISSHLPPPSSPCFLAADTLTLPFLDRYL